MKSNYVTNPSVYERYYKTQLGNGISGFKGVQRGNGLGSIFKGLLRAAAPLVRENILPFLKKKALSTGAKVARDVIAGRNLKTSLKRRLIDSGRDLAVEAANVFVPFKKRKQSRKAPTYKKRRRIQHRDIFS